MKKLFIIFGAPRSGTTYCADIISQKLKDCIIYDELNPSRLLEFNHKYYAHLENRASLTRPSTKNENTDRFSKIEQQFASSELSYDKLMFNYLLRDELTIIKYPRLLEDKSIYLFFHRLMEMPVEIFFIKVERDGKEILKSMQSRNMYFSRWPFSKNLAVRMIDFYDKLEVQNVLTIHSVKHFDLETLIVAKEDDLEKLRKAFRKFPYWISYIQYLLVILRNSFGRRYW
jgi:hypothetical protein